MRAVGLNVYIEWQAAIFFNCKLRGDIVVLSLDLPYAAKADERNIKSRSGTFSMYLFQDIGTVNKVGIRWKGYC